MNTTITYFGPKVSPLKTINRSKIHFLQSDKIITKEASEIRFYLLMKFIKVNDRTLT